MERLLVLGAGATIEECIRSGNHSNDSAFLFPTVNNFCKKLFDPTSQVLLKVTASYLDKHSIAYDSLLLTLEAGDTFNGEDMKKSPIGVFLELEEQSPSQHNIERLCEHAWQVFGNDPRFWAGFLNDGIYFKLFVLFTEQFGLGLGKTMVAGQKVAHFLASDDVVLNLNYDIAFDLALKQSGKDFRYSPEIEPGVIRVLKPHGSFNFYVNLENGNCYFEEPDRIPGSVGVPDPDGGTYFCQDGIVPPRLHKSYKQHPWAKIILDTCRPFSPRIVTFWGVGLTDSDIDLLDIYNESTSHADVVEFINPSNDAYENALDLLGRDITHFPTLEAWLSAFKVT